jgi:hypothetical protein
MSYKRRRMIAPLLFLLALSPPVDAELESAQKEPPSDEVNEEEDETQGRWGLTAVPRLALSSDDGIGGGARGTAFWYRWGQQPYKTAISFQAFLTSRLVQHHYVRVDAVDAFNVPLRLGAEIGYFQTLSANYCGLGDDVTCDDAEAVRAQSYAESSTIDAQSFVDRYYKVRFVMPYVTGSARVRLADKPRQPEVFGSYSARWYVPGTLFDEDEDGDPDLHPYPDSRFAEDHAFGQPGLASVLQLGASLDDRDFEPDPQRGFFVEVSARGSAPLLASAWLFGGVNITSKNYVPLADGLTLASRLMLDVMFGDAPYFELARTGGSEDEWAVGGSELGRGIRQQRYAGKVKGAFQLEARAHLFSAELLAQRFRFVLAPFVDTAIVLAEPTLTPTRAPRLLWGVGLALRVAWNDAFVMRVDAAASPDEGYVPALYTLPGHPF